VPPNELDVEAPGVHCKQDGAQGTAEGRALLLCEARCLHRFRGSFRAHASTIVTLHGCQSSIKIIFHGVKKETRGKKKKMKKVRVQMSPSVC
jgi:hypothetical protein